MNARRTFEFLNFGEWVRVDGSQNPGGANANKPNPLFWRLGDELFSLRDPAAVRITDRVPNFFTGRPVWSTALA